MYICIHAYIYIYIYIIQNEDSIQKNIYSMKYIIV